jgi:hypothetical protein
MATHTSNACSTCRPWWAILWPLADRTHHHTARSGLATDQVLVDAERRDLLQFGHPTPQPGPVVPALAVRPVTPTRTACRRLPVVPLLVRLVQRRSRPEPELHQHADVTRPRPPRFTPPLGLGRRIMAQPPNLDIQLLGCRRTAGC